MWPVLPMPIAQAGVWENAGQSAISVVLARRRIAETGLLTWMRAREKSAMATVKRPMVFAKVR
jgi:hypothetical protein